MNFIDEKHELLADPFQSLSMFEVFLQIARSLKTGTEEFKMVLVSEFRFDDFADRRLSRSRRTVENH